MAQNRKALMKASFYQSRLRGVLYDTADSCHHFLSCPLVSFKSITFLCNFFKLQYVRAELAPLCPLPGHKRWRANTIYFLSLLFHHHYSKTKGAAPANWSFYFRTSGDICNQLPAITSYIAEKKRVNPAPHKIILFILYLFRI